ncbi:hypothetical protein GQ53DRAFT_226669 [Thozetella sp. PMI_491]|nr:hypothetical protein GQ53DRAFT_226669 [Thozetella sp. PMI_491]
MERRIDADRFQTDFFLHARQQGSCFSAPTPLPQHCAIQRRLWRKMRLGCELCTRCHDSTGYQCLLMR